jgi:beta-lactamase superfamily II metal-dependent hydrolase
MSDLVADAEKFTIHYYDVGQGDCIVIRCPNGKLVMIDCGSAKGLGAANEDLLVQMCTDLRELTSKNGNKINILILTHRDKDHYNQVYQVFSDRNITLGQKIPTMIGKINIDTVYFSSPPAGPSANYALYGFSQGSCGSAIINFNYRTSSIKQVYINATEQKMVTYTKAGNFELARGTNTPITNKRLTLLKDTTPNGQAWSVSIIAGQVPESSKGAKDTTNALSLVTLLRIGQKKGLFLGDATRATEDFLLANQKSLIKNVDFVHIPHHGSETSSGPTFVKTVNPDAAEVTHETYETGFKLPKKDVLDRWIKILETKDDTTDHVIDYWERISLAIFNSTLKTWKTNKYPWVPLGTGYYLSRVPKNYNNRYVYIYKRTKDYWGLMRKQTDVNLWGTGATGYASWTLAP